VRELNDVARQLESLRRAAAVEKDPEKARRLEREIARLQKRRELLALLVSRPGL